MYSLNTTGMEGNLQCSNEDTSQCQILSLSTTSSGDFAADFSMPSAITSSNSTSRRRLYGGLDGVTNYNYTNMAEFIQEIDDEYDIWK